MRQAQGCDWPGNVRELANIVERAVITSRSDTLDGSEFLLSSGTMATSAPPVAVALDSLENVERAHIRRVLESTRWSVEGDNGAARVLGLNRSTLRGRLRKVGIRKA
jgi:transcriptional regulator with GAF, ATPase, and Fis domain